MDHVIGRRSVSVQPCYTSIQTMKYLRWFSNFFVSILKGEKAYVGLSLIDELVKFILSIQ